MELREEWDEVFGLPGVTCSSGQGRSAHNVQIHTWNQVKDSLRSVLGRGPTVHVGLGAVKGTGRLLVQTLSWRPVLLQR